MQNPYWQYFCRNEHFEHELPIDPSLMTKWHHRVESKGMEKLLAETIKTGLKTNVLKRKSLRKINVDTTVQEKAITLEVSFEDRGKARRERAVPILDEFRKLLDETSLKTPPRGLLGRAVSYTLNQWKRLIRYTEDGRLRPDNNLAENAIRPFVVGRKNWLFNGSPRGARASATIYSLIETAKANRLEPYRYLRYLFEHLPYAKSQEDYKALLPPYINRVTLDTFRF